MVEKYALFKHTSDNIHARLALKGLMCSGVACAVGLSPTLTASRNPVQAGIKLAVIEMTP